MPLGIGASTELIARFCQGYKAGLKYRSARSLPGTILNSKEHLGFDEVVETCWEKSGFILEVDKPSKSITKFVSWILNPIILGRFSRKGVNF